MTEESTVSPPEVTTAPRITAVTKTKNPNRVAQGKKLAAIRAEKRRMHELGARDPEPETAGTYSDDNDDGYQKMTFYFTLVSSVAALISIPFVYRYLTTSDPPRRTAGLQDRDTAVMTNRTTQAVQTTTPDKQPKKGPASDMIEFD
jgi:hypothetical protein